MIITVSRFVVSPWSGACALRGPEKGNLTFPKYVILDEKRQQTGSVKVKTELC